MREILKRIISYAVLIAVLFSLIGGKGLVFAEENIDEGKCGLKAKYVLSADGTLTISGSGEITNTNWDTFKEQVKKVVIEEGIINIPYSAFSNHTYLTEVMLANSIQVIDMHAFSGCTSLLQVNIPERVETLPDKMFANCTSLDSIVIPNNVKKIGDEVFTGCSNLIRIQMSDSIEEVGNEILKDTAYYNNGENWSDNVLYCGSVLAAAKSNIAGELFVKEGTRVISAHSLWGAKVTKVILPESMIRICNNAFYNCDSLKEVVVSDGLKYIEDNAFYSNDLLSKIVLPDTVTAIGKSSFDSCIRLVEFYSPQGLVKIGDEAFSGCNTLEAFTIPKSVAILGKNCFDGCDQLLTLTAYSNATPGSYYENVTLKLPETLEKIYAVKGSDYEEYAKKNGISFKEVEDWNIYTTENDYGKLVVNKNKNTYVSSYEEDGKTYIDYANIANVVSLSASASSSMVGNEPANMIDGSISTYWQCGNNAKDVYVIIDFGENIKFNKIVLWLINTGLEYEISISDDDIFYKQVMYATNPYESVRTDEIYFKAEQEARYIRMKVLYDHFRTVDGIYEIGVYGADGQVEKGQEATTNGKEPGDDIGNTTTATESGTYIEPTITVNPNDNSDNVTTTVYTNDNTDHTTTTTVKSSDKTHNPTTTVNKNGNISGAVSKITVPKIKKIKEKVYKTAVIKWTKSGTDCKYEIYRASKKKGKYKRIAIVSKTSYNDKKVKAGKKYFYKVKATLTGRSLVSKVKSIKIKGTPAKPSLKITTNRKSIKIKWGMLRDSSKGIEIYVMSKQGGYTKYTKINETTKLKKSRKKKGVTGIESPVAGLKKNVIYGFKARTYAIVKGKKVHSKWSKVKKIRIK